MYHHSARSESVIRISTTYGNEMEEAKQVLAAIQKIVANLEKIMRVAK
jgi:cysteine desulfurase